MPIKTPVAGSSQPSQRRQSRAPGRPVAAAGVDQRERMLDAALALFAEHGVAATPLRAIASAAQVTPALMHYYFAGKDALVDTLLAERVAPFLAVSVAPLRTPLPSPRATLRKFLETHMRNISMHPWMPRLMAREVLSEGGTLRARVQAQFGNVLAPAVVGLISAGQRRGEIRDDLDPLLIALSLISLAVFPFAAAPVWRGAAKSVAARLPGDDELIAHTLALFDSALEKPHAKSKR